MVDKGIISSNFFLISNKFLKQKVCPQIPNNEQMSGNFAEKQKWNNYKKKVYNDALKSRSSLKFVDNRRFITSNIYNTETENYRPKTSTTDKSFHTISNIDLIRNSRANIKSGLYHSQNFNFNLSNEIVVRQKAIHDVHGGKNRLRF